MVTFDVFVLSVLAGSFIALGAIFATTVAAGGAELPFGVVRLLAGLVFTLGLILVVVAGAELFTGNNLIVMAWASRRVGTARLLGNWAIVWVGNFVGAFATAVLIYVSEQYTFGGGAVGQTALSIGVAKTSLAAAPATAKSCTGPTVPSGSRCTLTAMSDVPFTPTGLDALPPAEVARKAE